MAAEQFGVVNLARAMAMLLPVHTIAQTWFRYGVSLMGDHLGSYRAAMLIVCALAVLATAAILALPRRRAG